MSLATLKQGPLARQVCERTKAQGQAREKRGLLVLSRKEGEQVRIDGPCLIEVLELRGDKVRIGFIAPETTKIIRTELEQPHG